MTNLRKKYEGMLDQLVKELKERLNFSFQKENLEEIKKKLIKRYRISNSKGYFKNNNIIHSMLIVLMSYHLITKGWEVEVEKNLTRKPENLVCDIYSRKGNKLHIVEVETGNIPSYYLLERNLSPEEYQMARVISKIARYSHFGEFFSLGFSATPSHNLKLLKPILNSFHSGLRKKDVERYLEIVNKLYSNPAISEEQIENAKLENVYLINIFKRSVEKILF